MRQLLFVGLLAISWCVMTFLHECGHVFGGFLCGAKLTEVELAPWRLPYSMHSPDPYPLVTLWAGPLVGVAVPVALAALIASRWAWLIADFCLVANGSYLALAWLSGDRLLDTQRLLDAGAHPALILAFCVLTIVPGYVGFRSDCIFYLAPFSKARNAD
ncbi:hypothetical protein [Neorhodopirellula lusitana]|uniref:hypothetical protein n=1 Tax=Neorhodopirellula lusitana TaxID=445327 RepID=UPI00385171ED